MFNKLKFGIILVGYNCEDYIDDCLTPWINYRNDNNNIFISVVSTQFASFQKQNNESTEERFLEYYNNHSIDKLNTNILIDGQLPNEIQVRDLAARQLIDLGVDYLWQVDIDEFYDCEKN